MRVNGNQNIRLSNNFRPPTHFSKNGISLIYLKKQKRFWKTVKTLTKQPFKIYSITLFKKIIMQECVSITITIVIFLFIFFFFFFFHFIYLFITSNHDLQASCFYFSLIQVIQATRKFDPFLLLPISTFFL